MLIILYSIVFPILTGAILLFIPKSNDKAIKIVATTASFFLMLVAILLFIKSEDYCFLSHVKSYTLSNSNNLKLFEVVGVNFLSKIFNISIDSISTLFILLTTILTFICFITNNISVTTKVKEFYICLLMLEGLIIGAFSANDLFLFYFFFEASLIPIFIIILGWGSENRGFAALKLFLYTLAGSVLLLISIIYVLKNIGSTNLANLKSGIFTLDYKVQFYLCTAMLIAFAIKIPMWPFHTWLPDAHVQAPTTGSMILAGILIKLGAYAMIKFCLTLFPKIMFELSPVIFALSIIAIIYASLVAMVQDNIKKMIAYSSVAHMGYVTLGIFSSSSLGVSGAIFQMISHGLISAGLFYAVGILYERFHSKQISELGGVATIMPKFSFIFVFLTMASIGLPATSGFVGEFLVLMGLYAYSKYLVIFAGLGIILGAIYMLTLVKKVIYGTYNSSITDIKDLTLVELLAFAPLIILIIILGVYPSAITAKIEPAVINIYNLMR